MTVLYSLRAKPNWDPSYSPAWQDMTDTLDVTQIPSFSISAERMDTPLVATVSDLSLSLANADNRWDAFFDTSKIVGTLPLSEFALVTAATFASPIGITVDRPLPGLVSGDYIVISGVTGNTAANGRWQVMVINPTEFTLNTSVGNAAYISGGLATLNVTAVRAPLTHYGQVMLCRKVTLPGLEWEVLFYGFITPSSVIFKRQDKTVSMTAYAAGTLLEKGNAERVHRFSTWVAARPFWLPFPINHPVNPPGSSTASVLTASNASPIDVTFSAPIPGLATGSIVVISGVTGNTAANGTWTVTLVGPAEITLNGSTGSGAFLGGGTISFGPNTSPDNTWWQVLGGALLPIFVGDQFTIIANPGTWLENQTTTKLSNTTFNVVAVLLNGADLYVQTAEAENMVIDSGLTASVLTASNASPIDITISVPLEGLTTGSVVTITGAQGNTGANGTWTVTMISPTEMTLAGSDGTASGAYAGGGVLAFGANPAAPVGVMVIETPWYLGETWEFLVQALVNEANTTLETLGYGPIPFGSGDPLIAVDVSDVPLLPSNINQMVAQKIYMADIPPIITGVAYGAAFPPATGRGLKIYRTSSSKSPGQVAAKNDIFLPNVAENTAFIFNSNIATSGYLTGPDEGISERIFVPQVVLPGQYPTTNPPCGVGQDLLAFQLSPGVIPNQSWFATHWIVTPSGFGVTPGDPVRCYRIMCFGYYDPSVLPNKLIKGCQITEFITSDFGQTWHFGTGGGSTDLSTFNEPFSPYGAAPKSGAIGTAAASSSNRPSLKVFQLGTNSYLYGWVDVMRNACYFLTATADNLAATAFFPPPASFIPPHTSASPSLSSSFIYDGTNVFFMCDRADGSGVDIYYWNGTTMAKVANVVNNTGIHLSSRGGDFINAIVDIDTGKNLLQYMVAQTLYVVDYTFSTSGGGTWTVNNIYTVLLDTTNYDPVAEQNSLSVNNPLALAWLTGKVNQSNPGEPDYATAAVALIVGTSQAVYIVSDAPSNAVEYADFEGLSCAGALQYLLLMRGVMMLTGADEDFVSDPSAYVPVPTVSFLVRLPTGGAPVDLSKFTEGCEDGLWLLTYNSFGIQNTKVQPQFGPIYNDETLTDLIGNTYTMFPPRYPGSSSLLVDNPMIRSSQSFAKLLCDFYAQDFVVPRQAASIVIQDPYARGENVKLEPLTLVLYLVRPPDDTASTPVYRIGRVLVIEYALDEGLLNLKVG